MTRDELFQIDEQSLGEFTMYYGEKLIGLWFDINQDPFYYIITNWKEWKEKNQKRDEEILEKYGKRVHYEGVVNYQRFNDYNLNQVIIPDSESFNGNIKTRKLVILGAGASFDYDYENIDKKEKWTPPLGNGLFDKRFSDIINKFPGVHSTLSELRIASDIESYFQQEWNEIENGYLPERLVALINIQYYLHYLSNHISVENQNYDSNNYDILVKNAYRYTKNPNQNALFITFNYETLLEQSIERICRISFESIDNYIVNSSKLIIIKPHGSCNWGWRINQFTNDFYGEKTIINTANSLYENSNDLAEINFQFIHDKDSIFLIGDESTNIVSNNYSESNLNNIFPALIIPYNSKDEFVLPKRHLHHLNYYLGDIEDVLVIGWKGTEEYFMNLLKKRLSGKMLNLTIVDPEPDKVEEGLRKVISISTISKDYSSFTEFTKQGGVRDFWEK